MAKRKTAKRKTAIRPAIRPTFRPSVPRLPVSRPPSPPGGGTVRQTSGGSSGGGMPFRSGTGTGSTGFQPSATSLTPALKLPNVSKLTISTSARNALIPATNRTQRLKSPSQFTPSGSTGKGGLKFIDPSVMMKFLQATGSRVRQTAGGYSYPEIPQETEQGIPDYYSASRARRGLPKLPPEAGNLARKIGRYVANLPADPDNRGSIEGTIAQVLVAAAQEAEVQGDAENASRLSQIAGQWAKLVRSQGLQAPDPDAPLPLAGFAVGPTFYGADDADDADDALTTRTLPGGWTRKGATVTAAGVAAVYGMATCKRDDDAARALRGLLFGGAAAAGAHVLLRVLGYDDAA